MSAGRDSGESARIRISVDRRLLWVDDRPAVVGARAFDLLLALIERRDRTVGKNELLDLVWPKLVVEVANLHVQVSTLRKVLGPNCIATVPGRGYRFTAPIDVADQTGGFAQARASAGLAAAAVDPKTNLPESLPLLIGRVDDLASLGGLIADHRLVTITGAGGIGKTRVAMQLLHERRQAFEHGVGWVDLSGLSDPALVVSAIAGALGLQVSGDDALRSLVAQLRPAAMLVALDNAEHLVDEVARVVHAIMLGAPQLKVLVTSQVPMGLPDEWVYRLGALAVPAEAIAVDEAMGWGGIHLFVERARAADRHFSLTSSNLAIVIDVCHKLDGLPLAIELAAARVRLLAVNGLRNKVGERFRLLTGGERTAMYRHQTLRAAIDWSYALLTAHEQTVLRRLGVFVGGFTLELAQQVVHDQQLDEWSGLDALSALVDKSLVVADGGEPPRYRLLETIRAYALEKLADAGETKALIEGHARATCELFVQTEEARFGEAGTLTMDAFLRRLVPELENARVALDWAMADWADPITAILLIGAGAEVFWRMGRASDALRVMLALQSRVDSLVDAQHAGRFWFQLASLGSKGRLPKALLLEAEGRAGRFFRASGERRRLHSSLCGTAWCLNMRGECGAAEAMLPEIMSLEESGWPVWFRSQRLRLQAFIYYHQERFEESLEAGLQRQALLVSVPEEQASLFNCQSNLCIALNGLQRYQDVIALGRFMFSRGLSEHPNDMANVMGHLMHAQLFLGNVDEAAQTMRLGLPLWRRNAQLGSLSAPLAMLLAELGRYADAARLDGATTAYIRDSGIAGYATLDRARARMQELFDTANVASADLKRWRCEGERLDDAAVVAICLFEEGRAPPAVVPTLHRFSNAITRPCPP